MRKARAISVFFGALGLLAATQALAMGIVWIRGTLDSITPSHYVIRMPGQSLVYIKKSDVDPVQRAKLKNLEQEVSISVDMRKIDLIQEPRGRSDAFKKRKSAAK